MNLTTDDGVRLNYQQTGRGPSLIFLHGFGGYQQVWARQVDYFSSRGYQVTTYDQRNHGASQFDPNLTSIHRLSQDLKNVLSLPNIQEPVLIGRSYGVLSQGERQAVMIARALMANPELLVLDEPCNGLDLFAREKLLNRVAKVAAMPNPPSLLMVSHYPEEILPCFNKVLLLRHGEVFAKGDRDEILSEATLREFYGTPIKMFTVSPGRVAVYPQTENEG
ncbi:alpha/beta fold hydrolase [Limosilactobacillus fermentum]|uniref:alpha/beta fold hydrolase n=1 Tax=Limosilactobacillus fermentum TaxID=1613 RepID=UPI0021A5671D|nr:alpha/beta fold hydrolase [Limosilactobacillus fermentum]MCT2875363.1 alpha/beta fold hydrolase [Limosilactobacillus fermentum]